MKSDKILLDHGSGGKLSHRLVSEVILPIFNNPALVELDDGAVITLGERRVAFSTDSYTVDPVFFPGGNIGDLAINGTVNDIAMCGGEPLYLSIGLIIEEGFPMKDLEIIVKQMGVAAKRAGVKVVTGDTKVVPKGAVDKIFINTSGVGLIPDDVFIGSSGARIGDNIILSGTVADHGVTIMTQREDLAFHTNVTSDSAPLNGLVAAMLAVSKEIHVLRDPTRGGVATALNEIAQRSQVGIKIFEDSIPVKKEVNALCELLGFDPLYLANEGKLLAFVAREDAKKVLGVLRSNEYGKQAALIGEVVKENPGQVVMQTHIGGLRIVDMLTGEQFPRIC